MEDDLGDDIEESGETDEDEDLHCGEPNHATSVVVTPKQRLVPLSSFKHQVNASGDKRIRNEWSQEEDTIFLEGNQAQIIYAVKWC